MPKRFFFSPNFSRDSYIFSAPFIAHIVPLRTSRKWNDKWPRATLNFLHLLHKSHRQVFSANTKYVLCTCTYVASGERTDHIHCSECLRINWIFLEFFFLKYFSFLFVVALCWYQSLSIQNAAEQYRITFFDSNKNSMYLHAQDSYIVCIKFKVER